MNYTVSTKKKKKKLYVGKHGSRERISAVEKSIKDMTAYSERELLLQSNSCTSVCKVYQNKISFNKNSNL